MVELHLTHRGQHSGEENQDRNWWCEHEAMNQALVWDIGSSQQEDRRGSVWATLKSLLTGCIGAEEFQESRGSIEGWKRKMLRGVKKKKVCNSCGNLDWRLTWFEFYINGHNSPKRKGEDNLGTVMNCRRRSWDWDRAESQNRENLLAVNKQAFFLKKQVQATVSYLSDWAK